MSEIKSVGYIWMAKCNQLTSLPFKGLRCGVKNLVTGRIAEGRQSVQNVVSSTTAVINAVTRQNALTALVATLHSVRTAQSGC